MGRIWYTEEDDASFSDRSVPVMINTQQGGFLPAQVDFTSEDEIL